MLGPVVIRMLTGHSGVQVTISKETTHILGPLRKDGYVDYVAALNERCSRGVTPENNMVVLFVKATGPGNVEEEHRDEYFRLLGIPPPPTKGDYFVPLERYAKGFKTPGTPIRFHSVEEAFGRLQRQMEKSLKPVNDAIKSGKSDPKQLAKAMEEAAAAMKTEKDDEMVLFDQETKAEGRPWSEKEFPRLAGWLAANEKPLARWCRRRNARDGSTQYPLKIAAIGTGPFGTSCPASRAIGTLPCAVRTRAMLRIGRGDMDGAWDDLLACHRLASLLGQGPGLIERLTAITMAGMAWDGDRRLLGHIRLTAAQAARIRADLDKLPAMTTAAEVFDVGERYLFLDGIGMAARDGIQRLSGEDRGAAKSSRPVPLAHRFLAKGGDRLGRGVAHGQSLVRSHRRSLPQAHPRPAAGGDEADRRRLERG